MPIDQKVKIALDETRMLALGAQILVGFQFRGVFDPQFDKLPVLSRWLDGAAVLLMALTLALLFLPGPYHRMVEAGNDTAALVRLIGRVAFLALAPFALSLGIDVAIVAERIVGATGGTLAGVAFALLALLFWYAMGELHKARAGSTERLMTRQSDDGKPTKLHQKIDHMLTEARVVLPGAQALLGFQLAIVLSDAFEKLPTAAKLTHGAALGCIALSIILLIAPAAYHRIAYGGEDAASFHRTGSRLLTVATLPLALGLACDVFVVGTRIADSTAVAVAAAVGVFALLIGCWFVLPLVTRWRRSGGAVMASGARAPTRS
ncbi:MAG: hypothetical protein JO021_18165 [Alphaproteobacteria bacterium]|nr:hypothetical protein [Alphaproteobacteria bacterium]